MQIHPNTTTVRDVVVEDYRTAAVFQRYGLDFCCGGGATIARAGEKKGIDCDRLLTDLEEVLGTSGAGEPDAREWDPDFLADYIVQTHHRYVRSILPAIRDNAEKVARVHGPARQELVQIATTLSAIADELEEHMRKEEEILFPFIKELYRASIEGGAPPSAQFGSVRNPIAMMEAEHDKAGEGMRAIRELSRDYAYPSDACVTYRVLFDQLQEFERDLHRHVHLENNILFPKVIALEIRPAKDTNMCMLG